MDAYAMMVARVAELQARFPQYGFTFGYIGNVERWGDDRSWSIYSKFQQGFGDYATKDLDKMTVDTAEGSRGWAIYMERLAGLERGEILRSEARRMTNMVSGFGWEGQRTTWSLFVTENGDRQTYPLDTVREFMRCQEGR